MPYSNIIKINRGDSFKFNFTVTSEVHHIYNKRLSETETVYFALLNPHQPFEDAIILQGYTLEDQDISTGAITVQLTTKETKMLAPGVYYYTVKLKHGGVATTVDGSDDPESMITIIDRTKFIVLE